MAKKKAKRTKLTKGQKKRVSNKIAIINEHEMEKPKGKRRPRKQRIAMAYDYVRRGKA